MLVAAVVLNSFYIVGLYFYLATEERERVKRIGCYGKWKRSKLRR